MDFTAVGVLIAVVAILIFLAWYGEHRKTGLPGSG